MTQQTWAVPCPPGSKINLNSWDKRYPVSYSKRILCFPLPDHQNADKIMESLHRASTAVVHNHAPFLAGTLIPGERPWLRDIRMEGSLPLRKHDLSSTIDYQDLKAKNFGLNLLDADELCYFPKSAYVDAKKTPVAAFQANFVKGGLLLTVEVIHVATDGKGITDIIELLAKGLRFASGERGTGNGLTKPFDGTWDRSILLAGIKSPGDLNLHPGLCDDEGSVQAKVLGAQHKIQSKMFHLSQSSVASLKEMTNYAVQKGNTGVNGNERTHVKWVSSHDALLAFVWRSVMTARIRAQVAERASDSYMLLPVDCRSKLGLPSPYFGNAIYPLQPIMSSETLVSEDGISEAATLIRKSITGLDADKINDALALQERVQLKNFLRLNIIDKLASTAMMITSYYSFPLYEMDFGETLGKIESFRLPGRGFMPGIHIIMPRQPDGSCDVLIYEAEQVMDALGKDDTFTKLAEPI